MLFGQKAQFFARREQRIIDATHVAEAEDKILQDGAFSSAKVVRIGAEAGSHFLGEVFKSLVFFTGGFHGICTVHRMWRRFKIGFVGGTQPDFSSNEISSRRFIQLSVRRHDVYTGLSRN